MNALASARGRALTLDDRADELLGSTRTVELSSGALRFRECGRGRPILFLHGLLVNGLLWRKVVPLLADRFRCVTPDLPLGSHSLPLKPGTDCSLFGITRSIAEFLEILDLKEALVVGNDSGGALAQALAVRHPRRIAGLVLTSSDCYENFLPPIFRYLQIGARFPGFIWLAAQLLRVRALRGLPVTFGWLAKRPLDGQITDLYLRPTLTDPAVRRDVRAVLRGFSSRDTLLLAREIGAYQKPVLLAWSREDRVFSWRYAERLAKDFQDAELCAIDDAYSFSPEDQPGRLAELIESFAERRLGRSERSLEPTSNLRIR